MIQAPFEEFDDASDCLDGFPVGKDGSALPWQGTDPGRSGGDNRLFVEAVLWKARTSSPWRDLPAEFGNWNTVFKRFDDWSRKGVFERIFEAVSDDPDMEYAMIDATIVPVHRHGHGAKGGLKIRRSDDRKADGRPKSLP